MTYPTQDEEGYVEWDRGRELAEEFVAKDQTLSDADIRRGQEVAAILDPAPESGEGR